MSIAALNALRLALGPAYVLTNASDCAKYAVDERKLYHGLPLAVVCPSTTEEVAAVVAIAAEHGLPMVPQGGNTGYCGGATPDPSGTELVISLERLNRIIEVDPQNYSMTVQAGVILALAQAAAAAAQRYLPLSMGSQGSCQIGGNLSTNAGGLAVLKYGTARDLVLGLEVVLPDGRICSRMGGLRKDNTGYDLKQLFVGAEGTLGIITAAILKLFPEEQRQTVWVAVPDCAAACALLSYLKQASGDGITSFEYITADALARVAEAFPDMQFPFSEQHGHQVLIEGLTYAGDWLEAALSEALGRGLIIDAVVASNSAQAQTLWRIRESIPAAEKILGGSIKHDVSLLIKDIPPFINEASERVRQQWGGVRLSVYGHLGDGNIHFNVLAPEAAAPESFKEAHASAISLLIHDRVMAARGSFSAEHGIGQMKRDLLLRYSDPVALDLMRAIKAALDPRGLMNPGKVIPDRPSNH